MQAEELQREMRRVRASLGTDVRNLSRQARESTDWRHYVRRYPWFCLGAVAATGYMLVPKKQPTTVTMRDSKNGHSPTVAGSVAGVSSALMAMVVRAVTSAVVQRGMDMIHRRKNTVSPGPERQDHNCASDQCNNKVSTGTEPW